MNNEGTYTKLLELAKTATYGALYRSDDGRYKMLQLFFDDKAVGVRFVWTVHIRAGSAPYGDRAKITGYDTKRDSWTQEVERVSFTLAHRRGEKALFDWLREIALAQTGFPNPKSLSFASGKPLPRR